MPEFWTQTTVIDHDVSVAPEVTLDVVVIDQDIELVADTPIDISTTVSDPDLTVENAEAEEFIEVTVSTGEKGDKGEPGVEGPPGPAGDGLQIDASGTFAGRDAYDSELEGFTYLDTTAGLLYVRETATPGVWSPGVDFGGADGTDGNTVLSGIIDPLIGDGVDGDFFINTVSQVIFGPKSTDWPVGVSIKGDPGDPGVAGNTVLYGNYVPTGSHGVDGNFFIHTGTYFLYGPKGTPTPGEWPAGTALKGDPGNPGADGNTILYGVINPTTEGTDGDFYINTSTSFIFGPKGTPTPGQWPTGTSLVGLAGADGNTILYGIVDPTTEGVDGNFYINTAENTLFGPKATTWPVGTSLIGPPGVEGASFTVDATGLFSGRSTYDSEAEGFSYLATDTGNLYIRETATPGVWSAAIPFGKGDQGIPGIDGKTILSGISDPTTQGVDGDYYINYITSTIFGPKGTPTPDVWPAGVSIIGIDGEGVQIDATGPTAERTLYDAEAEGFSFLDTTLALLYFRDSATPGDWSVGVTFGVGPKGDQGDPGPAGVYTGSTIYAQPTEPGAAIDGDIWIVTT